MGLSLLVLSACGGEEEIIEIDDFTYFVNAIDQYNAEEVDGVSVHTTQHLEGELIHEERVELLIDYSSPLKAKTTYYEKELSPFNLDNMYQITENENYYRSGQMFTTVEGDFTYSNVSESTYLRSRNLVIKGLSKDNFVDYNIQMIDAFMILEGELKIGSVRSIFGTDISMVESNQIRIVIEQESEHFIEFEFTYSSATTNMMVEFKPLYQEVNLVLPDEE
jgi:hypothetical protein